MSEPEVATLSGEEPTFCRYPWPWYLSMPPTFTTTEQTPPYDKAEPGRFTAGLAALAALTWLLAGAHRQRLLAARLISKDDDGGEVTLPAGATRAMVTAARAGRLPPAGRWPDPGTPG